MVNSDRDSYITVSLVTKKKISLILSKDTDIFLYL